MQKNIDLLAIRPSADRRARLCGECLIDGNYTKKENEERLVSEEELGD